MNDSASPEKNPEQSSSTSHSDSPRKISDPSLLSKTAEFKRLQAPQILPGKTSLIKELAFGRRSFRKLLRIIKGGILTGVFVVVPIFISLWIAWFIYSKLTQWSVLYFQNTQLFSSWCSPAVAHQIIRFCSLIGLLILLFLIGILTKITLGNRLIQMAQKILLRLPIVNFIYSTCKQIGDAIWSSKSSGMFHQVVLVEYPRKGCWGLGFMTNDNHDSYEVTEKLPQDIVSVFLPTTPNPTSGFLFFVPRSECIFLDMSVSDAMRLIVSCGAVTKQENLRDSSGKSKKDESSEQHPKENPVS